MDVMFQNKEVMRVEEDFKKVPLDEKTRNRIELMGKFFAEYFPSLSFLALKGVIAFGLRDWQVESKLTADELDSLPKEQLKKEITSINNHVKEKIKKLARNEDDQKIEEIFVEALKKAATMF